MEMLLGGSQNSFLELSLELVHKLNKRTSLFVICPPPILATVLGAITVSII